MTYTDAELLDALRAFADREGRSPKVTEANDRDDLPSAPTFVNHFGSWNAAVEAAGLTPRNPQRTDEELLRDLRRFADERDKRPSYWAVAQADCEWMATPKTYENHFGTWNNALREAGLPTLSASNDAESGD